MSRHNKPHLAPTTLTALTLATLATLATLVSTGCAGMMLPDEVTDAPSISTARLWISVHDAPEACDASRTLVDALADEVDAALIIVRSRENAGSPYLELTVTDAEDDELALRGRLWFRDQLIGTFQTEGSAGPSAFVRVGCGELEDAAEDVADNIATWLAAPTMNAELD